MGLFNGNRKKKLQKKYEKLLKEAMEAQRAGKIQEYADINDAAEKVLAEIKAQ